jgi:hypothetical protein
MTMRNAVLGHFSVLRFWYHCGVDKGAKGGPILNTTFKGWRTRFDPRADDTLRPTIV